LPGANVTVKGKIDKATITDGNGKFSIRMDANADAIEVSFIGYEPIKIKLGAITQNLTISLVPSTEDLNEVQVDWFCHRTESARNFCLDFITDCKRFIKDECNIINPIIE